MCVNLCVYVVFAAFIGEIKIYIIEKRRINFINNMLDYKFGACFFAVSYFVVCSLIICTIVCMLCICVVLCCFVLWLHLMRIKIHVTPRFYSEILYL